jgi:hypothetical protein
MLYSAVRPVTYETKATLVAVRAQGAPADAAATRSAAATAAELLRADVTKSRAGSPPVDLDASVARRSSVVEVRAESRSKRVLRPALGAVVAVARSRQAALDSSWELRTIDSPTAPQRLGASTTAMLGATLLLALLAPLLVWTATARPALRPERRPLRHEARPRAAATRTERRAWRYPTRL